MRSILGNVKFARNAIRVSKFSTEAKVVTPLASAADFYKHLAEKSAHKTTTGLAIADLKRLILKCEKPEDFQYALSGVELYQNRAQDFSEEICFHFIAASVKLGDSVSAAKLLAKTDFRIGSWVTKKSSASIFESLASAGETEVLLDLISSLAKRNVLFEPKVAANHLLGSASTKGDSAIYEKASDVCKQIIPETDLISLRHQYQAPISSTPAPEAVEAAPKE